MNPGAAWRTGSVWAFALIAIGLVANIAAWRLLGILPDEAYYWVWSQHLQAGYFDHPPLIAWLVRPFTEVFGDNAFAIRLPGVAGWFVGAALAYELGQRLYGAVRAGVLAVLVWSSLPIVQIGFHVTTPDTALVLCTWLTFYFALRAVLDERPHLWLAAGAAAGLTMLGKYPGLLVPVAILLGLAFTASGRRLLASRWPWLGALVAALVVSPMVWWNYTHDWVSFAFQFHHGVQEQVDAPLAMFAAFFAGQLLAAAPWTWVVMAASTLPTRVQPLRGTALAVLAVGFWLPLVLFGLAGLTAKSHPNWPVAAYVPGTLLLAGLLHHWLAPGRRARAVLVTVAVLGAYLIVNLLRFPEWITRTGIELPPQRTQLSQAYGWDEVRPALAELAPGSCVVLGDKLQTSAMVALLLGDPNRVAVSDETRTNQFHLWQAETPVPTERLCLYVEQFEQEQAVPHARRLGHQGRWRLVRVIEHHNPDGSMRRTALYRPLDA